MTNPLIFFPTKIIPPIIFLDPLKYLPLKIFTFTVCLIGSLCMLQYFNYLLAKLMITFEWKDARLQWLTETGIGNWKFPSSTYYPIRNVWVPSFRLANCLSERCIVKPQEETMLFLSHEGFIAYESLMTLRSTCNLDFTCMPCFQFES